MQRGSHTDATHNTTWITYWCNTQHNMDHALMQHAAQHGSHTDATTTQRYHTLVQHTAQHGSYTGATHITTWITP